MRRRLLLALLVFLPACGSDPSAAPPPPSTPNPAVADPVAGVETSPQPSAAAEDRLRAAPAATTSVGSARTTFAATLTGLPGRPEPVSLTGSGAVDFTNGRTRSNIDLSDAFELPLAETPEAGRPDTSWETVSADGVVYLRAPLMSDLLGIETPWVRIDPSSELLAAASGFAPLGQLAGSDSSAPLALLAGIEPGSVSDLGTEDVRGTPTEHLRASVDLLSGVGAGGRLSEAGRQALQRFVEGLGARQLTVDAFLDDDGRVRRLVYEHELSPEAGGGSQRVELDYDDFGAPVDITVPPEDQVSELDQVFGGG